jgi:hypothetical protein
VTESDAKQGLSEGAVKDALDALSWPDLKAHLNGIALDDTLVDELTGHIRRCGRLLLKHPDPAREARRDGLLTNLAEYLKDRLGEDAQSRCEGERATLRMIENGYRSILAFLANCEVSKLLPEVRIAAYLQRANTQYKYVSARVDAAVGRRETLEAMAGVVLQDDKGNNYSPDAVSDAIVTTLTSTLLMEGHNNGWFGPDNLLVIPDFEPAGDEAIYKAGSTEVLGICWRRWERTEERHRFLGTEWNVLTGEALPKGLPAQICRVIVTQPTESWLADFIANERLHDRMMQNFMEMSQETRMHESELGIAGPAPLLPAGYLSAKEAHSAVALSEMLGYLVADDRERPAGLRLVEWLRGYAFLQCLGEERFKTSPAGVIILEETELAAGLQRVGLSADAARTFIGHATLGRTSRDTYDCPLVKTASGKVILFAPGLLGTKLASVVLSNLGRLREPLSRKGTAFEAGVREFFVKRGMACRGFKVKRDGEEYEFDAVLVWGGYVFVFECKNRSLSGFDPVQAYYFGLENGSNAGQVLRLAGALERHPDILTEQFGSGTSGKKIVPCVLNSLPFSLPGMQDGVYFTDWSVIRRFFQERYIHVKAVHRLTDQAKLMHRSAVHSLWQGDEPTADDLIRTLDDPLQVDLVAKHTKIHESPFPIDPETIVLSREFMRENTTTDSFSEAVGVRPGRVRADMNRVEKRVGEVRRRHSRSVLRQQDCGWREMQKRE